MDNGTLDSQDFRSGTKSHKGEGEFVLITVSRVLELTRRATACGFVWLHVTLQVFQQAGTWGPEAPVSSLPSVLFG